MAGDSASLSLSPIKSDKAAVVSESPVKMKPGSSSSKVIDTLHTTIDSLSLEIATLKQTNQELSRKSQVATAKNDSFVDQLANLKHENDMLSALLKRKERRILDLEDQNSELSNSVESLNMLTKQMKMRCEKLSDSSMQSMAEYERLKISYDALVASCNEYKQHYKTELDTLQKSLDTYKQENHKQWETLNELISSNDKDIDTLLDSLNNKKKLMDNIYVNKNTKVLTMLSTLATLVKAHGTESKNVLGDNAQTIEFLLEKYPDLEEKILEKEQIEIDINSILYALKDALENTSFDEEDVTLINSPELEPSSDGNFPAQQLQKRHNVGNQQTSNNNNSNNSNNSNNNSNNGSSNHAQNKRKGKRTPLSGNSPSVHMPSMWSNNSSSSSTSHTPFNSQNQNNHHHNSHHQQQLHARSNNTNKNYGTLSHDLQHGHLPKKHAAINNITNTYSRSSGGGGGGHNSGNNNGPNAASNNNNNNSNSNNNNNRRRSGYYKKAVSSQT